MNKKEKRQRNIVRNLSLIVVGVILIIMLIINIGLSTCSVGSVVVDKKTSKVEYEEKNDLVQAENPSHKHMLQIKGISQEGIPTGCEAVSAVAVLNYLGIKISPGEFIDNFLSKQSFYYADGVMYGANPEEKFAGNPYDYYSLGCFPPVVADAIENMKEFGYKGSKKIETKVITEEVLEDICREYVTNNIPVLVWVTVDMKESKEGTNYYFEDGTEYTWMSGEHCMVLCGYDKDKYYFKDSLSNGRTVGYEKDIVALSYQQMGSRALVIYIE